MLMIHGFRGDHHGLQLMADALPEFELMVPDLPGFNAAPPVTDDAGSRVEHTLEVYAAYVSAVSEALRLGSGDLLLGHSFGTIVTAAHAAHTDLPWAGLILSAPVSETIFRWPAMVGAAAVEAYYQLSRILPERAGHALLRSGTIMEITNVSLISSRDPALREYVRDQHRRFFGGYSDIATLLDAYRASSRSTAADFAEGLSLPVLLAAGAEDSLGTPQGRRRLRDALPQGHLELVRGVGHLIHYEKPAELGRSVRRFARSLQLL